MQVYVSVLDSVNQEKKKAMTGQMTLFDFAPEVIDIIIAAIIYCGALSLLFKNTIYKFQMRKAKKAEKKSGTDRAGKEGQS